MNIYKIEYVISPFDGGEHIKTGSSFEFTNKYDALAYAKALVDATVNGVGHVVTCEIWLNGSCQHIELRGGRK